MRTKEMNPPIRNIIILGGGTSGWMTACFLQRNLNRYNPNRVSITVIEGDDGPIGVGEATIPSLRNMLSMLGIDERQFMIETDATFKMAIRFENWTHSPSERPGYFYHLFDRPQPINGIEAGTSILASNKNLQSERYAELLSVQPALCDHLRSPKLPNSPDYMAPMPYAYHLDAIKFGRFLRKTAVTRGVRRVTDHVVEVIRNEQGYITLLRTVAGQEFAGDLYVDCTGFKGLLINQTYQTPFIPWDKHLYCDRAVAFQIPTPADSPIRPYTLSTAVRNGWIWEIALRARKGIGYVYSSQFATSEQAEQELREHIGPAANELSARHINMRVGRNSSLWVKNCVAIGLSAGFLEPLESTGIFLTEIGLMHFMENYPLKGFNDVLSDNYNAQMARLYDEVLDFIVMHYCLTQREDTPFWNANKYHPNIPDGLKRDLLLWQNRLPSPWDKNRSGITFACDSYLYILAGMRNGELPGSPHDGLIVKSRVDEYVAAIAKKQKQAIAMSSDHGDYIRGMHTTPLAYFDDVSRLNLM